MKNYCRIIGGLLSVLFLFSACQEKDLYTPGNDEKLTDLVVPADFNWEMSTAISFVVTSPVQTTASVYLTQDCDEDGLLATLSVSEKAQTVELSVPAGTKALYIKYPEKNGNDGVLPISLLSANTRFEGMEVKLPESVGETKDNGKAFYYPSMSENGTVLFEDNWPSIGDYDFNDLVAQYNIKTTGDQVGVSEIEVMLYMNALGGLFPYQFCLMLDGIKASDIADITIGDELGQVKLITTGDDTAVLSFDWSHLKGSLGGQFYNTEIEYAANSVANRNMNWFFISLKSKKQINNETFNFFIRNSASGNEIHLMGYKHSEAFEWGYKDIMGKNYMSLDPTVYYKSAEGLVWGLKVPKAIAHAREHVDFCQAYPDFAKWVKTGGQQSTDWYERGVQDKLMPMFRK